jgi:hypothetical protein
MLVHSKLCIHENDHIYLRKNIYKKCEMGCDVLDAMVVRFTSTYVGLLCPITVIIYSITYLQII